MVKKPFLSLHKISVTSAALQQRAGEALPKFTKMMFGFFPHKMKQSNYAVFNFMVLCYFNSPMSINIFLIHM